MILLLQIAYQVIRIKVLPCNGFDQVARKMEAALRMNVFAVTTQEI